MKKPLEKVFDMPQLTRKRYMSVKTARRFLARNAHKIKVLWIDRGFGAKENSFYHRVMKARLTIEQYEENKKRR